MTNKYYIKNSRDLGFFPIAQTSVVTYHMPLMLYLGNVIIQSHNLALMLVRCASMIESSSSQNCFIACNCKCFKLLLLFCF
jgi:hypothetical protein